MAGFSLFTAAGGGEVGARAGVNLGGALLFGTGPTSLRISLTTVFMPDVATGLWLLEFGLVRMPVGLR